MEKPPIMCDRCSIAGHCLLNYDGGACRKARDTNPINADLLRSMSIRSLAELISQECPAGRALRPECENGMLNGNCVRCWESWLLEEVAHGR